MQSLTDQITYHWDNQLPTPTPSNGQINGVNGTSTLDTEDSRMDDNQEASRNAASTFRTHAIAARDFMICPIPAHELEEEEIELHRKAEVERLKVMKSWSEHGGVWVKSKGRKRWIGVDDSPR